MKTALHGKPQILVFSKSKSFLKQENNWKCWSDCSYSHAEIRHLLKCFTGFILFNSIIQLYIQRNWKQRYKIVLYIAKYKKRTKSAYYWTDANWLFFSQELNLNKYQISKSSWKAKETEMLWQT